MKWNKTANAGHYPRAPILGNKVTCGLRVGKKWENDERKKVPTIWDKNDKTHTHI